MNNDELDKINSRLGVLEVALAYTINNVSANLPGTKIEVIAALRRDFEYNKELNQNVAKSLHDLANLIETFSVKIKS